MLIADLLGGEAVDLDRGVGAGVVVATRFEQRFEARARVAGEEGTGLVGGLGDESLGGDGGADGEPDGETVGEHLAAGIVGGSAAAGRDDHPRGAGGARKGAAFQVAEGGFALLAEDGGNGLSGGSLDERVAVDEGPAEAIGEQASDRGLAAPGEAERGRCGRTWRSA